MTFLQYLLKIGEFFMQVTQLSKVCVCVFNQFTQVTKKHLPTLHIEMSTTPLHWTPKGLSSAT